MFNDAQRLLIEQISGLAVQQLGVARDPLTNSNAAMCFSGEIRRYERKRNQMPQAPDIQF
jgi:hypothetical protein